MRNFYLLYEGTMEEVTTTTKFSKDGVSFLTLEDVQTFGYTFYKVPNMAVSVWANPKLDISASGGKWIDGQVKEYYYYLIKEGVDEIIVIDCFKKGSTTKYYEYYDDLDKSERIYIKGSS